MELRPLKHIQEYSKKYPDCWKSLDYLRNSVDNGEIVWEKWCFLPIAAAYSLVSEFHRNDPMWQFKHGMDAGILTALYTWRISQGIYKFDSDFFDSLTSTPIEKLPIDILCRLPEWCVYIESNGSIHYPGDNDIVYGYYVHLEHDMNDGRTEVRFVFDTEKGLFTFPLHLKETVDKSILACYEESQKHLNTPLTTLENDVFAIHKNVITKAISPLLYLCSENQDIKLNGKTDISLKKPLPKKTKKGIRFFPPEKPSFFEVGFNVGKTLRSYSDGSASGTHSGPRPHIRRSHWHTFLSGKRDSDRIRSLKWLPPIPVNFDGSEITPTIHHI